MSDRPPGPPAPDPTADWQRVKEEQTYWRELAARLGMQLVGWDGYVSAGFRRPDGSTFECPADIAKKLLGAAVPSPAGGLTVERLTTLLDECEEQQDMASNAAAAAWLLPRLGSVSPGAPRLAPTDAMIEAAHRVIASCAHTYTEDGEFDSYVCAACVDAGLRAALAAPKGEA